MKDWCLILIETLVHQRKSFVLTLLKQGYNFAWVCIAVMIMENFEFKANNKNVNFPAEFCLESISNGLGATDTRKVSLKGIIYDLSVDYNAIDKSGILNNHKCLMVENNIK